MEEDATPKVWPIDQRNPRMIALRQKPLRANGGVPALGKNGAKPFKMPTEPMQTLPFKLNREKPLRFNNGNGN